jgi:hypothetical protein
MCEISSRQNPNDETNQSPRYFSAPAKFLTVDVEDEDQSDRAGLGGISSGGRMLEDTPFCIHVRTLSCGALDVGIWMGISRPGRPASESLGESALSMPADEHVSVYVHQN